MIKDRSELEDRGIEIDLSGPEGNAFVLIGYARKWAKQLGKDPDAISKDMESGDYEHLVEVLEREFGDSVTIYRNMEKED